MIIELSEGGIFSHPTLFHLMITLQKQVTITICSVCHLFWRIDVYGYSLEVESNHNSVYYDQANGVLPYFDSK